MMRGMCVIAVLLGLTIGCMAFGRPDDEEDDVVLTLEKVSAPFDKKAKIFVEQKGGKFKEYGPRDHKTFEKEVDEADLEITEYHIRDRKIIKIVFQKKLK